MPGKVNPVIPEVVTQVAAQVIGNDAAITVGGLQGHFELNVFVPLLARNLLQSIQLLASSSRLLAERCVDGIEANREQCERYAELTLSAATALNPYIGYDKAAEIVKEASTSGRSLREVAREAGVEEGILDAALDFHTHGQAARLRAGRSAAGDAERGVEHAGADVRRDRVDPRHQRIAEVGCGSDHERYRGGRDHVADHPLAGLRADAECVSVAGDAGHRPSTEGDRTSRHGARQP